LRSGACGARRLAQTAPTRGKAPAAGRRTSRTADTALGDGSHRKRVASHRRCHDAGHMRCAVRGAARLCRPRPILADASARLDAARSGGLALCDTEGQRSPRCAGGGKALHQRGPRQPQDAGRQPRARDNTLSGHDQRARRRHGSGAAATTDRPPWSIGRLRRRRFAPGQRGREGIPRPPRAVADGDSVTAACRPQNANYGKPPAGRSIASGGPTAPVAAITAARTAAPPHSATDRSLASTAASWHQSVLTARSVFPAR
jgi:hypothetical protein